jgi:thiamine pyrophosphokinase
VTCGLPGPVGATITLLPFGGDAAGITTSGLAYPLRDEPLTVGPARGLSNVRTTTDAAVTVRSGRLLVVETALLVESAIVPARLSSGP